MENIKKNNFKYELINIIHDTLSLIFNVIFNISNQVLLFNNDHALFLCQGSITNVEIIITRDLKE